MRGDTLAWKVLYIAIEARHLPGNNPMKELVISCRLCRNTASGSDVPTS